MQHLGEICMAQRSRGKDKQDKRQAKARKEIQKRSFWRRFFSSFLSLLKEKRPSETKVRTCPAPQRGTSAPAKFLLYSRRKWYIILYIIMHLYAQT